MGKNCRSSENTFIKLDIKLFAMSLSKHKKGTYLAVASAVVMGLATVVGTQISKQIPPILFASVYMLLSVPFLILLSVLLKEKINLNRIRNGFSDIMGVVITRNLCGTVLLLTGFSLTTAVRAVFLLGLDPVFVTILGWKFLDEKIDKKQSLLILSLLFGVFLLSTNLDINSLGEKLQIGDLLVMSGVFCMSLSYLPSIKAMKKINSVELTLTTNLIGGVLLLIVSLFLFHDITNIGVNTWWMILVYVVLFSVLSLYTFYSALKYTKPWIVSSLLQLAPVPGAIFAYLWLRNVLTPIQAVGGMVIMISSYLIARGHHK